MKKLFLVMASITSCSLWLSTGAAPANAQSEVLAEMYGRGVHAYYAGRYDDANEYLSMAIDNGLKDPRAYYFRGIVAAANRKPQEAENDWKLGAQIEATTGNSTVIGQALARFQGPERMKLEEYRQKARLEALARATARSQQRYGEIESSAARTAAPRQPQASRSNAIEPPKMPSVDENPFLDDVIETAGGEAKLESKDAFAGAAEGIPSPSSPAAGDEAPAATGATDSGKDPFGAGDADPFGGGGDPFGGDSL